MLAHEIGDAVWREARRLDHQFQEKSQRVSWTAAEVIGRKLLEPRIFGAIRSKRYRSILRQMSDEPRMHFRRSELLGTPDGR